MYVIQIFSVDGSGLVHEVLADLKTTCPVPCMQVQERPKSVLSHVWRCWDSGGAAAVANKAHINYLSRLIHNTCRGWSGRWWRWCRSSCRSRRSRWWRRRGGQELKLAKLERIPCFPQLFTTASTRGRGSKQLARGQSSNISNLPFHQKDSIFAEEETFASSMSRCLHLLLRYMKIWLWSCVILVLLSCLFAILTVKKICDLNEQVRTSFVVEQLSLSYFHSSFLYNLMDKNMSVCRLIPTAQNLFLRQQLALERQKVRDGVFNLWK